MEKIEGIMGAKELKKEVIESNEYTVEDIVNKYKILDEKCDETLKKIKSRRVKNGKKE